MTARNIREYQVLGLLPPPVKRGRTGYYGAEHLERGARIRTLRDEGFTLDLIRRVIDEPADAGLEQLTQTLLAPFQDEEPQPVTRVQLAERFGAFDDATLDEAVALGIILRARDGALAIPSPRLARVGDAMVGLGLGLADMVALTRRLRPQLTGVADVFADFFRERLWAPFEDGGGGDPSQVATLAQALRPMVLDTVVTQFKIAMDEVVDRAMEEAGAA